VPEAIEVTKGATDGKVTEIIGGELKSGMEVITEAVSTAP
jgi:HlyD family secretion protein